MSAGTGSTNSPSEDVTDTDFSTTVTTAGDCVIIAWVEHNADSALSLTFSTSGSATVDLEARSGGRLVGVGHISGPITAETLTLSYASGVGGADVPSVFIFDVENAGSFSAGDTHSEFASATSITIDGTDLVTDGSTKFVVTAIMGQNSGAEFSDITDNGTSLGSNIIDNGAANAMWAAAGWIVGQPAGDIVLSTTTSQNIGAVAVEYQ